MRGNHRHTPNNPARSPMPQQPPQPVRALPHTDSPQPNRIAQVRQQREVRDTARRHPRVTVTLQVSVMKHAEPRCG